MTSNTDNTDSKDDKCEMAKEDKDEEREFKNCNLFKRLCSKWQINTNLIMLKVTLFVLYGGKQKFLPTPPRLTNLNYDKSVPHNYNDRKLSSDRNNLQ